MVLQPLALTMPTSASFAPERSGLSMPSNQRHGTVVVGLGRSGIGAARLLQASGEAVRLLESRSDSQEDMAFLNRLSDHAAIAISNAQLYGEVQRANLAKSDFVSFVAHELKKDRKSTRLNSSHRT